MTTKAKKPPKERKTQFDPAAIEAAAAGETGIGGDPLLPGESLPAATETLEAPPAEEPPPPDEPPTAEAVAEGAAVETPAIESAAAPVEASVETPAPVVTQTVYLDAPPSAQQRAVKEIQDRLCEQHLILLDAESEYDALHKQASEAKKEMEAEQKRLNGLVQELHDAANGNYTPSLPFEDRPLPDYGFKPLGADAKLSEPAPVPAPEPWRAATLAELGIKGKLAETLEGAGLSTLGAITDYTAQDKRLIDIPGIGEGKAVKIADLCADYFKTHPQPSAEVASEAPAVEAVACQDADATPESSEPEKPAEPIVLDMSKAIEFTPEIRLTRHASGVITTVEAADGWRGGWSGQCRGGMKKVPLDADRKPYDARWKAMEEQVDELAEWLSGIGENAAAVDALDSWAYEQEDIRFSTGPERVAYGAGRDANEDGKPIGDCTHTAGLLRTAWLAGWMAQRAVSIPGEMAPVDTAMDLIEQIRDLVPQIPEAGEEFGRSVLEKAVSIGDCPTMLGGVERWIR